MMKFATSATLTDPVFSMSDWQKLHGKNAFGVKKAAAFPNTSRYLLSHCTIMSSVMTEPAPHDYLIKPECSYLVNNNDDAWSNEVLELSHRTFVGGFNFVEHYQNTQASKGHIVDSILRKIHITPDIWVYFCDILVATELIHTDLIAKIRSGEIKYLSMGCVTDLVTCTYCGHQVTDQTEPCFHLVFQKGHFMPDDDGVPRRIAELCGDKNLPNGGVKFVEASWVETPAFPGAVKRSVVSDGWEGPASYLSRKKSASNPEGSKKVASIMENQLSNPLDEMTQRAALDLKRRLR